jgi:hypothetical protein
MKFLENKYNSIVEMKLRTTCNQEVISKKRKTLFLLASLWKSFAKFRKMDLHLDQFLKCAKQCHKSFFRLQNNGWVLKEIQLNLRQVGTRLIMH